PPVQPDAHQGVITGVALTPKYESGAQAIQFIVRSLNEAFDDKFLLWLPRAFAENINVDKTQLPSEAGNNQSQQYAMGIRNTDNTATLQVLLALAAAQGNSVPEGTQKPSNLEEYVELLAAVLVNTEVVFTRSPDTGEDADPAFKNRLKVRRLFEPEIASNPKRLKKYRKAWEIES
ncbi:MAG: hypothetical protein ACRD2L_20460, partial [Terriglobia bacterium]